MVTFVSGIRSKGASRESKSGLSFVDPLVKGNKAKQFRVGIVDHRTACHCGPNKTAGAIRRDRGGVASIQISTSSMSRRQQRTHKFSKCVVPNLPASELAHGCSEDPRVECWLEKEHKRTQSRKPGKRSLQRTWSVQSQDATQKSSD